MLSSLSNCEDAIGIFGCVRVCVCVCVVETCHGFLFVELPEYEGRNSAGPYGPSWAHVGPFELIGHMCCYGPKGPIWAIMGPRTISKEKHGITRRACKLQHGGISHLNLRALNMSWNGQLKMLDTTMS